MYPQEGVCSNHSRRQSRGVLFSEGVILSAVRCCSSCEELPRKDEEASSKGRQRGCWRAEKTGIQAIDGAEARSKGHPKKEGERKLSSQRCQGGMKGTGNHTQPLPPERSPHVCGVTSINALLGGSELKEAVVSTIFVCVKERGLGEPSETRSDARGFVFKEQGVLRNRVARRFVFEEAFGQGHRSTLVESDKPKSAKSKSAVCVARGASPDTAGQG